MLSVVQNYLWSYLFRDGVSEGQFYQVLLYELDAIRKVLHLDITVVISLSNIAYSLVV